MHWLVTKNLFKQSIWYTVNIFIFAGGKFREIVDKTFHLAGRYFQDNSPILLIVSYRLYVHMGEIFAKRQYCENYTHAKIEMFTVISSKLICFQF